MAKCDPRMKNAVYINGDYWVEENSGKFIVYDKDGCGPELYHEGDTYSDLDLAKKMADFWQGGGHWMDRPDMEKQ